MRKYFILFFLILLVILFSSCKTQNNLTIEKCTGLSKPEDFVPHEDVDLSSVRYAPAEEAKAMKNLPEGQIKLAVLSYHHIEIPRRDLSQTAKSMFVTPENFKKQMKYLHENGFAIITADQMMDALNNDAPLPQKSVLLTFDDGYKSFYKNAFPILKKYNFHAVQFVIAGYFNRHEVYMTKEIVKEISDSGFVEVGSHTMYHPFLSKISRGSADYELKQSKKVLSDLTGKEVKYIAYPYGSVNQYNMREAAVFGYKAGFGVYKDYMHYKKSPFLHNRVSIQYSDNLSMFAKKVEIY